MVERSFAELILYIDRLDLSRTYRWTPLANPKNKHLKESSRILLNNYAIAILYSLKYP